MSNSILTFDTSLKRTAFACQRAGHVVWGARSFIKPADPKWPDERFNAFRRWADKMIVQNIPELIVYEKPTTLGQGSGAPQIMLEMTLRELCAIRRIPVQFVYPAALKLYVTDSGKAEKAEMMAVMQMRFPEYDPAQDPGGDVADALALLCWARDGCPPSKAEVARRAKKIKATKGA